MFRPAEWWKEQKIELLTGTTVTGAGPRRAHGQALEQGGGPLRQGAARQRRQRPPPQRRGLRAGEHLLPAHARQRRRHPRRRGGRRGGRPDRRLLHRLRGGGLADDAGQALLDRDAGAAHARTRLRRGRPGASSRSCSNSTASSVHPGEELDRFEGERPRRVGAHQERTRAPGPGGRDRGGGDPGARPRPPRRPARSASSAGSRCRLAPGELRCRTCSPRATSANTSPSSTAGRRMRIEHWDVAFNQGKTAALNMLGRDVPHDVVPYFYSVLGDWGELEYVGPACRVGRRRSSAAPPRTAASRTGTWPTAAWWRR